MKIVANNVTLIYYQYNYLLGNNMGKYVTVSTKVRRELKEEAERLGVKISEVLRCALEEEVRRRRIEDLEKKLEKLEEALDRLDMNRIVRMIREDREMRLFKNGKSFPF